MSVYKFTLKLLVKSSSIYGEMAPYWPGAAGRRTCLVVWFSSIMRIPLSLCTSNA